MKLVFFWDGLEETYEGETWKKCCEECVSQEENWDIKLTKIMMVLRFLILITFSKLHFKTTATFSN